MTEREAIQLHIAENIHRIEVIEDFLSTNSDANDKECRKNIDILTKINKALEEVEQYREYEKRLESVYGDCSGLLETLIESLERHNGDDIGEPVFKSRLLTDEDVDKWEAYKSIGTPDECMAAVAKQKVKKPIIKYKRTKDCLTEVEWKCPTCEANYIELAPCGEWCRYCGTKFDWSDKDYEQTKS